MFFPGVSETSAELLSRLEGIVMREAAPAPSTEAPVPATEAPDRARGRFGRWRVLGVGCVLVALFSCGLVGLLAVFLFQFFQRGISSDPAVVRARLAKIAKIDVPPPLSARLSYEARVPWKQRPLLTWVIYDADPDKSTFESYLSVGQWYTDLSQTRDNLLMELQRSQLEQDIIREAIDPDKKTKKTLEYTINGTKTEFVFQQGTGAVSDEKYLLAYGQFRGREGPAILNLCLNAKHFDEATVKKIIQSISTATRAK